MSTFNFVKNIVAVVLLAFTLESSNVTATLEYGECTGLRLDNSSSITPRRCVSLGGKCCDVDPYMIDDPRTMKATDKCLTCYNPDVKMKCSGRLIRSRPSNWGADANSWVTAKTCIAKNGRCCKGLRGKLFDPNSSPDEIYCNDCYSGTATSSTGCGGKLLASATFTAPVCVAFGGHCCDGDFTGTSTGSAFCTSTVFNPSVSKKCNLCYSGSPRVAA